MKKVRGERPPLLLTVSALALGGILLPFYVVIMWVLIIAMLLDPSIDGCCGG